MNALTSWEYQPGIAIAVWRPFSCFQACNKPSAWRAHGELNSDRAAGCILTPGSIESPASICADKQCS
ncbi:hypothetical protein INR49_022735 [Caranx melampygus]|nr:hypothetical protein INR49_022735 [Caranx melampygus]